MKLTTVYLPEETSLVLKRLARKTGRSQAELIGLAMTQIAIATSCNEQ